MLDFGWPELFLIVAIAVFLIGPKELPGIMVALGRVFRRFQYIKYAISQQFDDVMRDADMGDIRKSVNFESKEAYDEQGGFDEAAADEEYAVVPDNVPAAENQQGKSDE